MHMNLCTNPACTWHIIKRKHNKDNAGVQIWESNNNTTFIHFSENLRKTYQFVTSQIDARYGNMSFDVSPQQKQAARQFFELINSMLT